MYFQGASQFVEGGAGGHYVIHHQYVEPAQIPLAGKGAADVLLPGFPGQAGLRRRFPHTKASVKGQRNTQLARQGPGNFHRLIEAPLFQVASRKRHGQQQVGSRKSGGCGAQSVAEKSPRRQLVTVLEGLHQGIHREVVNPQGEGPVKVGRVGQALAAKLSVGERERADRADRALQRRQIIAAVRTKKPVNTGGVAQKAMGIREQKPAQSGQNYLGDTRSFHPVIGQPRSLSP